jgi:hypothetical protein
MTELQIPLELKLMVNLGRSEFSIASTTKLLFDLISFDIMRVLNA